MPYYLHIQCNAMHSLEFLPTDLTGPQMLSALECLGPQMPRTCSRNRATAQVQRVELHWSHSISVLLTRAHSERLVIVQSITSCHEIRGSALHSPRSVQNGLLLMPCNRGIISPPSLCPFSLVLYLSCAFVDCIARRSHT